MNNLRELYLRRNNIAANLEELECLQNLRNLKVLNLAENPISAEHGGLPHYRTCVLHFLPHLEKLDDIAVVYEEAQRARAIDLETLVRMVAEGDHASDEVGGSNQQAKKRPYTATTFIPSESQQYVPQKKFSERGGNGIDE